MNIKCRENIELQIYHHPHYQILNEKLMEDFSKINFIDHKFARYSTNIKGDQFQLSGSPLKPRGVDLIEIWVKQILEAKLHVPTYFSFVTELIDITGISLRCRTKP